MHRFEFDFSLRSVSGKERVISTAVTLRFRDTFFSGTTADHVWKYARFIGTKKRLLYARRRRFDSELSQEKRIRRKFVQKQTKNQEKNIADRRSFTLINASRCGHGPERGRR